MNNYLKQVEIALLENYGISMNDINEQIVISAYNSRMSVYDLINEIGVKYDLETM